jgi:polygalacturonase
MIPVTYNGLRARCAASLAILLVASTSELDAQDARHVVEPQIPPACAVLEARLAAVGGVLPADAEKNTDTARIQHAMDQCPPG